MCRVWLGGHRLPGHPLENLSEVSHGCLLNTSFGPEKLGNWCAWRFLKSRGIPILPLVLVAVWGGSCFPRWWMAVEAVAESAGA